MRFYFKKILTFVYKGTLLTNSELTALKILMSILFSIFIAYF